jgi:hypothetical protein
MPALILACVLALASGVALWKHAGGAETDLAGDPASPTRWCDVGESSAEGGRTGVAEYCFRRAVELGPNVPEVLLRARVCHFAAGETQRALVEMRGELALTREYDDFVFTTYRRMDVPVAEVEERGLPPEARVAFLRHLLAHGEYEEAANLRPRGTNRVFNGGFEEDPLGLGLDWRIEPAEGVTVERDRKVAHTGSASLRLHFDGQTNLDYRHVVQPAVVHGGTYRLRLVCGPSGLRRTKGSRSDFLMRNPPPASA